MFRVACSIRRSTLKVLAEGVRKTLASVVFKKVVDKDLLRGAPPLPPTLAYPKALNILVSFLYSSCSEQCSIQVI